MRKNLAFCGIFYFIKRFFISSATKHFTRNKNCDIMDRYYYAKLWVAYEDFTKLERLLDYRHGRRVQIGKMEGRVPSSSRSSGDLVGADGYVRLS